MTTEIRSAAFLRLFRSIGVYTVGLVAQRMLGFLLLPIYTRYIPKAHYGVLGVLDTTMTLFSMLAGARFSGALYFFHANATSEEERRRVFSTMLVGMAGLGVVGAGLGCLLASRLSDWLFQTGSYADALRIMMINFAFGMVVETVWNWLRAENRVTRFVVYSMVQAVLSVIITLVLLLGFAMSFRAVLWGTLLANIAVSAVLALPNLFGGGMRFDTKLFGAIIRYGAPIGISGTAAFVLHSADRFFLTRWVSLDQIGEYELAYRIGMMVSLLQTAFNQYWLAQIHNHVRGPDGQEFFERTFTYLMAVVTFVSFALWALARPVVVLMADPAFHGCVAFVPWLLLAYWIRAGADYFRMVFFLKKNTTGDAVVSGLAATICVIAYAVLIPRLGVWGAIFATLIGFGCLLLAAYVGARRALEFRLEWTRLLRLPTVVTALGLGLQIQATGGIWIEVARGVTLIALFPLILAATGFFDRAERDFIKRALAVVRSFVSPRSA